MQGGLFRNWIRQLARMTKTTGQGSRQAARINERANPPLRVGRGGHQMKTQHRSAQAAGQVVTKASGLFEPLARVKPDNQPRLLTRTGGHIEQRDQPHEDDQQPPPHTGRPAKP